MTFQMRKNPKYDYDSAADQKPDWRDWMINNAERNAAIFVGFLAASLFIGPSDTSDALENVKALEKPLTEQNVTTETKPAVFVLDWK